MIFEASEAVQLAMLAACFGLSLVRALRTHNAVWLSIVCFFACMLLGNVYYYGFMVVFDDFPHYSYIADLSWIAGYIFLTMLLVQCNLRRWPAAPVPAAWVPVAICVLCCIFYIYMNGYPLLNIADNGLMGGIGFFAVRGLLSLPGEDLGKGFAGSKPFHAVVLAFVVIEQGLWLSSLIPDADFNFTVYSVFNYALTLSYASILACAWRHDDL